MYTHHMTYTTQQEHIFNEFSHFPWLCLEHNQIPWVFYVSFSRIQWHKLLSDVCRVWKYGDTVPRQGTLRHTVRYDTQYAMTHSTSTRNATTHSTSTRNAMTHSMLRHTVPWQGTLRHTVRYDTQYLDKEHYDTQYAMTHSTLWYTVPRQGTLRHSTLWHAVRYDTQYAMTHSTSTRNTTTRSTLWHTVPRQGTLRHTVPQQGMLRHTVHYDTQYLDKECYDLVSDTGVDSVKMMYNTLGPLERSLCKRLTTVLSHHCSQVVQLWRLTLTHLHHHHHHRHCRHHHHHQQQQQQQQLTHQPINQSAD